MDRKGSNLRDFSIARNSRTFPSRSGMRHFAREKPDTFSTTTRIRRTARSFSFLRRRARISWRSSFPVASRTSSVTISLLERTQPRAVERGTPCRTARSMSPVSCTSSFKWPRSRVGKAGARVCSRPQSSVRYRPPQVLSPGCSWCRFLVPRPAP